MKVQRTPAPTPAPKPAPKPSAPAPTAELALAPAFDLSRVPVHRPDSPPVPGGGGEPLPAAVRARFEPRFGADLGHVRVHRDPEAARWTQGLGANAATVGNHVSFAPGRFAPGSSAGDRVIAHEIAHVLQHANGAVAPGMTTPGDAAEREASQAAERVTTGHDAGPLRESAATVARDTPKGGYTITFEVDPTNPNQIVHEPAPETRPQWVDTSLVQVGYTIWLFGYDIWVKDHEQQPIRVPEEYVNFTAQKAIAINHHIYDSYAEASAAVAKAPRGADTATPRYAYYWGAGGLVIMPTLVCPATAPLTTETMWETRVKYADYVQRQLVMLAGMMIFSRILGWLWGRFGQIEEPPPPSRPARVPPGRPAGEAPEAGNAPEPAKAPEPVKTEPEEAPEPVKEKAPEPAKKPKPKSGETEETAAGKKWHKVRADQRRASGDWDEVNKPIKTTDGKEIRVPRKVNLKTGEAVGDETQTAQPDAVSYKRNEILDDKPVGRPVSKDRQEMIRNCTAYKARTGHYPDRIIFEHYDPATGQTVSTRTFSPDDFLPK